MIKRSLIIKPYGFSLLELTIVLFILAIVLTGVLVPLSERQDRRNRDDTKYQLELIKEAIMGYTVVNNRLPCPDCSCNDPHNPDCTNNSYCSDFGISTSDVNDGIEDYVSGYCPGTDTDANTGNIPWVTLGMKKTDAWGNNYSYKITSTYVDTPPANTASCYSPDMSFNLCDIGNLEIVSDVTGTPVARNVVAVIVSHGSNYDLNNPSVLESENLDGDEIFVNRNYSRSQGGEYDDILYWISPYSLKLKMVEAGRLP